MNDYGYVVFRRTCWLTYVEFLHSSMLCCITTFMKGYIALAHTSMVMLDCNCCVTLGCSQCIMLDFNVPYSYVTL
jgi:hypothetical protein